ncbi:MAG: ABC transporter ATP-binding protein [Chloroflexota bacterium]|nr:ABC transporter ATP-binding protein [Chloroflexota bacterium]
MTFMLETRGLSKQYGTSWALRDCTLQIPSGHVAGLVGPNGAGKTTLLHLAIGLLDPSAGSIEVLGDSPHTHPREVLARVGFVAQNRPLYKRFTVEQHLQFGAWLNQRWDHVRARERLARYNIALTRKVGSLSGGQQAQVSLVLALAKCPQLLLLDEPLSNLDPLARQEFLRSMLVAATEEQFTVLFSSHVVAELGRFCDYVILLAKGQVQLAGDVDALLAAHRRLTRAGGEITECEGDPGVVSLERREREITMIVQKETNINRLGWQEHAVTLEDVILAYMAHPAVNLRSSLLEREKENVQQ